MKIGTMVKIENIADSDIKFKAVADCGFTACQLVYKPDRFVKEDAAAIKNSAEKYNIDISAQFCGPKDTETVWDIYYGYQTAGINVEAFRMERLAYIKKQIEFSSWLGVEDVVIHAGFIPNNPFAPEYGILCAAVYSIAQLCLSYNMNLLFETGGEAPITLLRLIEDVGTNNLYINFDPANIYMYGLGNPVDALHVFGKYVRNFHGKDGRLPTSTRTLGEEKPVGEGMVDFDAVFKMFSELGYDRYVIIEREISGEQQKIDILKAKQFFERLIDREKNR